MEALKKDMIVTLIELMAVTEMNGRRGFNQHQKVGLEGLLLYNYQLCLSNSTIQKAK